MSKHCKKILKKKFQTIEAAEEAYEICHFSAKVNCMYCGLK